MVKYTVLVSKLASVELPASWPELSLVCLIDDELKKQGAPHVGNLIISPSVWFEKIQKLYTSISVCKLLNGDTEYCFTLGEVNANNKN